jgi:hypothetical protein
VSIETKNTHKSRQEVHRELMLYLEIQLGKWQRERESKGIPYQNVVIWANDWLSTNTLFEYRTKLSHIELASQRLLDTRDWYEMSRMIHAMKKQIRLERPNPHESEAKKVLV